MPWDKRGYYYRKKRIGSRVVSEYVGVGFIANLEADADQKERHERNLKRADEYSERETAAALDESMEAADALITALMRQELEAAGYRQHARGQWRKRREIKSD